MAEPGLGARTATLAMDRPAHGVVTYAHTGSGERLHGQDGKRLSSMATAATPLSTTAAATIVFSEMSATICCGAGKANDSVQGDAENDRLYGDQADDTLVGGAGRHSLFGGTGADRLHGGSGRDGLRYLASSTGVTVNPSTRSATDGHAQGDVFSDIENLAGSAHEHHLSGSRLPNSLWGHGGNDTLYRGRSWDRLEGGQGADNFVFVEGSAIVGPLRRGTPSGPRCNAPRGSSSCPTA